MFKSTKQSNKLNNLPSSESEIYAAKLCEVIETNNYEKFSYIGGNRPVRVNKAHFKNLKDSISIKQIPVPIVVNENYEICDGQNRFEACKKLKKPVFYIKIDGLGLEDVQRLNANTKNWDTDDFLDSFCAQGIPAYLEYRAHKEKYKFPHTSTQVILSGGWEGKGGKNISQVFKDGNFEINDHKKAYKISDMIVEISKYFTGYKEQKFILAMLHLFKHDEYSHATFMRKLARQSARLTPQADKEGYLTVIEGIYNNKQSKENKVKFIYI